MKYAVIDSQGVATGFYSPDVHGEKGTAGSKVPTNAIEITDEQWQELLKKQQSAKVVLVDGEVTIQDRIIEKSLNELQKERIALVEKNKKKAIEAGMNYTFPDGTIGTIQTRDIDLRNIGFVTQAAMIRVQTGSVHRIPFRDRENVIHQLDPQQFINLATDVFSFISLLYEKSWTLKDNIRNETDKTVIPTMPISV